MSDSLDGGQFTDERERFLAALLTNPIVEMILQRMPELGLTNWYLAAGGVFQTIWNVVTGRDPQEGIKDYDVFYFDSHDLSYEAEDAVIKRAIHLFSDVPALVEVRNEARVHLWYEAKFGVPAYQFTSSEDAIDHFASTTCCYGVTVAPDGAMRVYAPHGFHDLFALIIRPNPILAPREVYEAKTARWREEWSSLTILPWPTGS
jgi:uncharacterized protein